MITLPARYQPTSTQDSGGMSHATVCRDSHLDRLVLVKELQQGVDFRRILDEVAALSNVRSKHVVQIYDVVRDASSKIVGIVEEYLPGQDLLHIIPIVDTNVFLKIAYAIACGLADIHAAGRVHRDIKPNNIKFDAEGCLKIFDFGLSRSRKSDANTQGAVGTRGYMAPELCVNPTEIAHFDWQVDAYAFAATMLKLVLGTLPRALSCFPPQLPCGTADFGSLSFPLPADVAGAMNRCLAELPTERPTMATIRDLISAHLLQGRHRATFVVKGVIHVLHAGRRAVTITLPGGVARLSYDGLGFLIRLDSGSVYVNNIEAVGEQRLPQSCVITFGSPALERNRRHIPIDVSHPEVVT